MSEERLKEILIIISKKIALLEDQMKDMYEWKREIIELLEG